VTARVPTYSQHIESRSISYENQTGAKGQGGMAGGGRKGAPALPSIKSGETATLAEIDGPGVIRHMWFTIPQRDPIALRNLIFRFYWDHNPVPAVEIPFGDFFGLSHGRAKEVVTAYTTTPLGRGFNAYYPMPFREHARITVSNEMPADREMQAFFYQIDYELHESLPANTAYFHASFRRECPTIEQQDFVVLDGVEGPGYFLGCVIGVRALGPWWWGEGEMKFYLDGDDEYPTICGTGTEDYFGAGWGMAEFQSPQLGCTVSLANDYYQDPLVAMYRFHKDDPVYFQKSLRATIQQLGWKPEGGLFERSDDWAAAAFWYQAQPLTRRDPIPDVELRSVGLVEPETMESGE
jgi:hypothetical protein